MAEDGIGAPEEVSNKYALVASKVDPNFGWANLTEEGMIRFFDDEKLYRDWLKDADGLGSNEHLGELSFRGRFYDVARILTDHGGSKIGQNADGTFHIWGYAHDGHDVREILDELMARNPKRIPPPEPAQTNLIQDADAMRAMKGQK